MTSVKLTHALAELSHFNVFHSQNIIWIMAAKMISNVEQIKKIARFNLTKEAMKKLGQNVMKLYVLIILAVSYFSKLNL